MLRFILVCLVAFAGYYIYTFFPVSYGPGITAPDSPVTSRITWEKPFTYKTYTIEPIKKIEGTARVIRAKRYFFDKHSSYSPVDVLVGWSDLSDERNLDHIHFTIKNRSAKAEFTRPPVPLDQIYGQTDLWHMIGSTEEIDKSLKRLREGNLIRVEGFVVNVKSEMDFDWHSELTVPKRKNYKNTILWVSELTVK